jgi:hypothetical protein
MFVDEAPDPSVVVPGAVLVAGNRTGRCWSASSTSPAFGSDRLAHAELLGVLFPCDLNFEGEEASVVLAPLPAAGAPGVGEVVFAGTSRTAWSPARVEVVGDDRWMHLRLLTRPEASAALARQVAEEDAAFGPVGERDRAAAAAAFDDLDAPGVGTRPGEVSPGAP